MKITPQDAINNDVFHDIDMHAPYMIEQAHGNILEIGVREGCSTASFLLGLEYSGGHLYSVDIEAAPGELFAGHPNWTFIQADSQKPETLLPQLAGVHFDILFIDGDHSYEAVANDLKNYAPLVKDGGKIILHDVLSAYDPGVRQAVDEFVAAQGYELEVFKSWVGLGTIHVRHRMA